MKLDKKYKKTTNVKFCLLTILGFFLKPSNLGCFRSHFSALHISKITYAPVIEGHVSLSVSLENS